MTSAAISLLERSLALETSHRDKPWYQPLRLGEWL
jgi:hypothetical protein